MTTQMKEANQAVFDAALKHIRAQGEPCLSSKVDGREHRQCMYRSPTGLQCAFGPCIENYDESIEGDSARDIIDDENYRLYPWARDVNSDLAATVQSAHDRASDSPDFMAKFESSMRYIAETFGVTYEPA